MTSWTAMLFLFYLFSIFDLISFTADKQWRPGWKILGGTNSESETGETQPNTRCSFVFARSVNNAVPFILLFLLEKMRSQQFGLFIARRPTHIGIYQSNNCNLTRFDLLR